MKQKFTAKSLFYLVLICLPILIYFITVVRASINFPIMDDYDAILNFLIVYTDASTFYEKINAVFSQHNEHRIVYTKLVVLGYHKIFGAINFIPLIVIGNLSLVGILVVFYKSLKIESLDKRLLILIPVAIFLFNYRYAELSCWAMTSIQNIGVLFFAFLALYFLLKDNKPSMAWAIVFASLATYTSGNGILTFVTGIIVLILKKESRKSIYIFGCAFILNLATYFIGLKKVEGHPPFLQSFIANPLDFFLYPLNFLGALFYTHITVIGFVFGALVLAVFVFIYIKKIYESNYVLFAFLLFMLATVGVITISRFGFGVGQANSSRYAVNSSLIYIIIGLIFSEIYYSKITYKFYFPLIVLIMLFNWSSIENIKGQLITAKYDSNNIFQITNGKIADYNLNYVPIREVHAVKILIQANERGLFATRSHGLISPLQQTKNIFREDSSKIKYAIEETKWVNDSIYNVVGWILLNYLNSYQSTIMVGIEDSLSQMHVESTQRIFKSHVAKMYNTHNCDYNMCGFSKYINISKYPKGDYKLSVLISVDSLYVKLPLNKIINK